MSDAVLIALIGTGGSILTSILAAVVLVRVSTVERRTTATHDLVNGKMGELTEALTGKATAEGFTMGEQSQRERQAPNGERL